MNFKDRLRLVMSAQVRAFRASHHAENLICELLSDLTHEQAMTARRVGYCVDAPEGYISLAAQDLTTIRLLGDVGFRVQGTTPRLSAALALADRDSAPETIADSIIEGASNG